VSPASLVAKDTVDAESDDATIDAADSSAPFTSIDANGDDATIDAAEIKPVIPTLGPLSRDDAILPVAAGKHRRPMIVASTLAALLVALAWQFVELPGACYPDESGAATASRLAADALARRIVTVESGGDASARNPLSSATGAGQFLAGTWLDMIRAYRPDLSDRDEDEILDLRRDPDLSREMVARFAEENAAVLVRRCLPVTPGTLYLSHFAGGAGAVAVLSAPEQADAATTMAEADATGRTTRDMIVTANPFLARFTVADLRRWADRKMQSVTGLSL
jgi:hypothetical protein